MNQGQYTTGKVRCSACAKFIDPLTQKDEISVMSGRTFHDKRYCTADTTYPARLRYRSRYKKHQHLPVVTDK